MYETRNRAHGKARMTSNQPPLEVKLWGDYACFTRPEMKVERVSYPVMTPSAARGILEAIFWKPEMTCVKGVDKTYQWGGAKVYHQRGHWPA